MNLTNLVNHIKESNFSEANEIISDALFLKIDERFQEMKESCGCNNGNESVQYVDEDGEADGKDGDEYKKFFQSALKKFGAKSPQDLKGDKKKEFYDYVDKNWKSDAEKETGEDDPVKEGTEIKSAKEKEKIASSQEKIDALNDKESQEKSRKNG